MLFNNNAGSSLLQHVSQSYSDIESLQFADLIRDYSYRRKLRKYRFQEEVLSDLREEREIKEFLSSYDPFIDHYCFDEPIQTAKQAKYPFRNAAYADKILAPIAGSRNRLMRLYERLGFIPVGDNEVVLVTPKAYSTYLSNIDDLMPAKPHLEKHSPYDQKERAEMMEMMGM